jgi:outer membrane receptor protein involved in Fe transport
MVLRKQVGALVLSVSLLLTISFTGLLPQVATAQMVSGDLVGTVVDSTGAAIPSATVTATNTATGVKTTTTSNGNGEYRIPNLLAGSYDVSAMATGFTETMQKGFAVQLSTTSTLPLTLAAAGAATTVEVSADAGVALDTTTVQLEQTFSSKELTDLPTSTVGLGVLNLSLLSPGVASAGALGAGTGPSVGGQRPRANNFTIEGIDNNDKSVTGPLVYVPNDAVGSFTLITNQFSPEFGHSAGGQFNTTIKSGTNSFHGSAYEYFDNRNLNAENATAGNKSANARYDYNRYGGDVGGPILKDKLFFFGNYERQTLGQSASYVICTPTVAGLATLAAYPGLSATNLAEYLKFTPAAPTQVNTATDAACFNGSPDPAGAQALEIYPGVDNEGIIPDYTDDGAYIFGSGTPTVIPLGNVLEQPPSFANTNVLAISTDYTISNNDNFRGRYVYNDESTIDTAANLSAFYQPVPYKYHLIALSEYHNFTPSLTNEARLGFNRYFNNTPSGNIAYPGLDSFPSLYIYDQDGLEYGPDGNAPQSTIQNLYQFTDNVSWVKGNHTIKIGFDGRKYISPQSFTQRVRGDYEWSYLSEFLHDLAPTAFGERSTGNFFYYGDQTAFYGYGNDTWRIKPNLTLNLGLRYEFTSVPTGERPQVLNIAASVPGLINFGVPQPQYKNFAPRFGVDWAPDQKTSVRAGFGMAYDVLYDNLGILSFPPQYSSTTDVGGGAPGEANPGDPGFLAGGGLPAGTGGLATFCLTGTGPGTGVACSPDIRNLRLRSQPEAALCGDLVAWRPADFCL